MFTTLSLSVPASWKIPEILSCSSAEENKLILDSGCQILISSRTESAGLNNKDEQLRLRKDAESKIDEARSKFNKELDDSRSKFNDEKLQFQKLLAEKDAQIDILTVFKGSTQSQINEVRQDTRNSLMEEMSILKEEITKLKRSSDEERLRWLDRSKEEREIARVALERGQEAARIERELIRSSLAKERDALLQQLQESHRISTAIQVRKANSSTKGGDNEHEFSEIIKNTFGTSVDFVSLEKQLNSGDHRFDWEGYRIMAENKIGYTESKLRQKDGLPKAIKDFTNNTDCNLLLFISEDTVVPDHSRPGDIDFSIVDRRPAIFVGNFARQDDKISYINSILMPMMRILLRVYKNIEVNKIDDTDKLGDVIHKVQCLKNNYVTKFNEFQKTLKAFERLQTSGIDGIKSSANSLLELFSSSLNSILDEEDKSIAEEVESSVKYTNEALQLLKMEPELQDIAKKLNISGRTKLTKADLIKRILEKNVDF